MTCPQAPWPVYFWENCVSPHKLPLFRALADRPEIGPCVYVAQDELFEERVAQGWHTGPVDDLDIRFAPSPDDIDRIMRDSPPRSMHFFSGTHWVPCITQGIKAAIRHDRRFALTHEPRVREGVKGRLRLIHSWATERHIRRHAEAVMAIGRNGPSWFRMAGYRPERIFPFAYYLPSGEAVPVDPRRPLRIGYIGRLVEAKGINLFLDAIRHLSIPCEIRIAGAGTQAPRVNAAARADPRISYLGLLPMPEVSRFLAGIDILVAPSITTDDGWGAAVSEALIAGAAVVATDRVGASICLDEDWRGEVVRRLDPEAVVRAVERVGADPARLRAGREHRSRWGNGHLSAAAGAAYVVAVLGHLRYGAPRPRPFHDGDDWA